MSTKEDTKQEEINDSRRNTVKLKKIKEVDGK